MSRSAVVSDLATAQGGGTLIIMQERKSIVKTLRLAIMGQFEPTEHLYRERPIKDIIMREKKFYGPRVSGSF
jgi:hypothetical protein